MTRSLVRFGLLAALAILAGCAASGTPRDSVVNASSSSPDIITLEEIQASPEGDALSIVQSLRPQWLRRRTVGTLSGGGPVEPEAFVDGTWMGPVDYLRRIQAQTIQRIDYIGPQEAATRYGLGHGGAVIHVYTRRL